MTLTPTTLPDFEETVVKTQKKTFKIRDALKCFAGLESKYAFVSLQVKLIKDCNFLLSFANQVSAYIS